jgi:aconitate hydratase
MSNSFNARDSLEAGGKTYEFYRLGAVEGSARLPFATKILLENLLRNEDGVTVTKSDIEALANWDSQAEPSQEIQYRPARVLMQDFTGVPAVVDLAAMRDAIAELGGDPEKINPLQPAELVIDHSVQVDKFGLPNAAELNARIEFERNRERYQFLKWGQQAFNNFKVVPPDTGIVHQVNVEYLSRVVFAKENNGVVQAYPDTVVGTDSHTTMVNGLGVLGWGVGGIEAEAAMLGQPISMLVPKVVGMKLTGELPEGATATDLVLTIVEKLREHGVVGKFVEFYGDALSHLPMGDRATIANMGPEYGATCGLFPIDDETLGYMRLTGRSNEQIALTEAYAKAQGMWRDDSQIYDYSETVELDISTTVPSISGPKRPQDRIELKESKAIFERNLSTLKAQAGISGSNAVSTEINGEKIELGDGSVVIAAITSCTNTSNPSVMIAAGLVAKKAVERGLDTKPWVKTSLAPGSLAATDYLQNAGLLDALKKLRFEIVGYGCTTCIGNSGPLPEAVSKAIAEGDLSVTAVLSGNRNFEGRVHAEVRMNYLASPPLVVAYALAGTMDIDLYNTALGTDTNGNPVFLKDIWPTQQEVNDAMAAHVTAEGFRKAYENVFQGDSNWNGLSGAEGQRFAWNEDSTYIRNPPYFAGMSMNVDDIRDIHGARVLALLGDSVTTDHISPAGAIKADAPAGKYLQEHGVAPGDFNSYGSRRGNHEVMMRGTFANIRLRNLLAPGTEGGVTRHQPDNSETSIYEAAMQYQADKVPAIIIAGKEYGSGSSRDWAAKGPRLLGVKAVIAESYERIHRTNLVCMGILPLQFKDGETPSTLGLSGKELYSITGLTEGNPKEVVVTVTAEGGHQSIFNARVRIDTPNEWEYYRHGGILQYVLRHLASS